MEKGFFDDLNLAKQQVSQFAYAVLALLSLVAVFTGFAAFRKK